MMNEHNLSLNLGAGDVVIDPYWFNMEIKKDPLEDGMTVADAAGLIDSVYLVKPCATPGEQRDVWDQDVNNTEASEEAQKRFAEALDNGGYGGPDPDATVDDLIPYTTTIKIFRSHRAELYKLQMANGRAGQAIKRFGRVVHTVNIDGGTSHTFKNPILRGYKTPVITWQGIQGPQINITGNTIHWDGAVTGTLRAEFYTEWDEVVITVTGDYRDSTMITGTDYGSYGPGWYSGTEDGSEIDDYQNLDCTVLAFYHFQYEELILNRPAKDESTPEPDRNDIDHFINTMAVDDGDDGEPDPDAKCQQHVNETIVCQCDGKEDTNSHYEVVPCPAGVSDGATLQGSQERRTYKDCGYRDEANSGAVYEERCCENWPFNTPMPLCKKIVKKFNGMGGKAFPESDYPDGTNFIAVGPTDGQCGEHTIEQIFNDRNCCDTVPELVWDYENSAEVIDSSAIVFVGGGKSPYHWKVRHAGVSFDPGGNIRDITTDLPEVVVYADESVCGAIAIYVTDNCTSASGYLRSINGYWEEIWWWQAGSAEPPGGLCPVSGGETSTEWLSDVSYNRTTIQDNVAKLMEQASLQVLGQGGGYVTNSEEGEAACAAFCNDLDVIEHCVGEFESGVPCLGDNCTLESPDFGGCGHSCYPCSDYMSYRVSSGGTGNWYCGGMSIYRKRYYRWVC